MSRADDYAAALERVNTELVDYLRGMDAEQWLARGVNSPIFQYGDEDENRPCGLIAHHVAMGYRRSIQTFGLVLAGRELPRPSSSTSADDPVPDQAATIGLLEETGGQLAAAIRDLTDEQLDRDIQTFLGPSTLGQFIERAVVFHPHWHLTSIQATVERAAQPG